MLEKCCEIINRKKDAAYLETDQLENVPFYEKFGIAVTGEEQIFGCSQLVHVALAALGSLCTTACFTFLATSRRRPKGKSK